MLNKIVNLRDVYFQWLHSFQLPSLFKYLNITVKSMTHGPSLYISHSLTTDSSLLSFKILDSDTDYVFNKKLKMRLERKSCSLQNLHFWKRCLGNLTHVNRNRITHALVLILTVRTRWAEPNEALPKQRTEWENSSFSSTIPTISKQKRHFCVSSEGSCTASTHATAACIGGGKPPSWYLSIYTIWESYIHWW